MSDQNDLRKSISRAFGPPAFENDKGKLCKLNENFWAAYYANQASKMIYEPDERIFYYFNREAGIFITKSPDLIRTELSALIMECAQTWGSSFVPLMQFRNESTLSGVLSHLR